jgi:dTDP-4-dehydrorhamnose 3,5-epimerase
MKFIQTPLKGAYIIDPEPFEDKRGLFERIFCEEKFREIGHSKTVVQINHSLTKHKGSLRGMHYQEPPMAEIKMVKCLKGSVYDVIVDLRKGSDTFLKWFGETLSSENRRMMYVPEGFAHGFQTLEYDCELLYFHTEFYSPDYERTVRFNDPRVSIRWPLDITEISERDLRHALLSESFEGVLV